MKLKVQDIKTLLCLYIKKDCEVFKSGGDVVLYVINPIFEDKILNKIHKENLLCVPEMIPTDGYYRIKFKEI